MKLSTDERSNKALTQDSLTLAVQRLKEQGYVILERVMPERWTITMNRACQSRLNLSARRRHISIGLRREPPFDDPLIRTHPLVLQILHQAISPEIRHAEFRILSCLPQAQGSEMDSTQGVHRDHKHLFPEIDMALPTWCVQACIALTDFTAENGATEVWPGSHLIVDPTREMVQEIVESIVADPTMPSCQLIMPAGSIALMDSRILHRAMPNKTDLPRTMLGIGYHRAFGRLNHHDEPVLTAEEAREKRRQRKRG